MSERYARALATHGVTTVWVEDELSEGIVPVTVVSEETRRKTSAAVATALTEARTAMSKGKGLPEASLEALAEVAEMIAREVQDTPNVAVHLADMLGSDQYLLQHCIDVTA